MLLIIYTIFISGIQSKYLNYTNPEKDYSFEVNSNAHYLRKSINAMGYTDVFNVTEDFNKTKVNYSIIISKVIGTESIDLDKVISDAFRDAYIASCNCQLLGSKKADTKNLSGALYNIKMNVSQGVLVGYSYNIPKGKTMYNITYLTSEENLKVNEAEYIYTINSMKILK
jgi:hypothetical protein